MALPFFTWKCIFARQREELWRHSKISQFHAKKDINLQNNPLKQYPNPSRYYNFVTKSQVFNTSQKYHVSRILI